MSLAGPTLLAAHRHACFHLDSSFCKSHEFGFDCFDSDFLLPNLMGNRLTQSIEFSRAPISGGENSVDAHFVSTYFAQ